MIVGCPSRMWRLRAQLTGGSSEGLAEASFLDCVSAPSILGAQGPGQAGQAAGCVFYGIRACWLILVALRVPRTAGDRKLHFQVLSGHHVPRLLGKRRRPSSATAVRRGWDPALSGG